MEKKWIDQEQFSEDSCQAIFAAQSAATVGKSRISAPVRHFAWRWLLVGLDKVEAVLVSDLPSQVQKRLQ